MNDDVDTWSCLNTAESLRNWLEFYTISLVH